MRVCYATAHPRPERHPSHADIEEYWAWVQRAAAQERSAALHVLAGGTYHFLDPAAVLKGKAMYERAAKLGYAASWVSLA